jgi:hypothetical protein
VNRLPPALCALAVVPFLLGGCEGNTCKYGSEGSNASDCKARPAPTEAEAAGWRADSLRARLGEFETAEGARQELLGVTVTRWGEMLFETALPGGESETVVYDVDGQRIEFDDFDHSLPASGDVPFRTAEVDPGALEAVMARSEDLHPGFPFVRGELAHQAPRIEGGRDFSRRFLSWEVTVGEGSDYVYYETDDAGRILCERISGAEECTPP